MNILAALARESLLSERVISMEADGASAGLPMVNPGMPQNTTPSSQMAQGASNAAKPNPTGGKVGSVDANNVVNGDQNLATVTEPVQDTKRLLLEAGYFGVCALKNTMEAVASDVKYIESQYGDAKAKMVTEMVQALTEMKTQLSEMYDAKGGEAQSDQQAPAPTAPVDQASQSAGTIQQSVPAVDVKENPEV